MKFGLFGGATAGRNTATDNSDSFQNFVDFVVEADNVGLTGLFVVEHHFTGFGQVSATMNLLTYLAAKTKNIRLGPGVMVLPWHNPVLLAEQAATLDVLSGGRLDMGVGKGYRYNEFQHFCVPLDEAEERFQETVGLMKRAWTSEERFTYHSDRWNFADIIVEPAPVQKPHPPLWLAAGRPESIRAAARGGYNLLLDQFATFDVIAQRLAIYRDEIVKMGKVFDPMTVGVSRAILMVRNAEERAQGGREPLALARPDERVRPLARRQVRVLHDVRLRPGARDRGRRADRRAGRGDRARPRPAERGGRLHIAGRHGHARPDTARLRQRGHARGRLTAAGLGCSGGYTAVTWLRKASGASMLWSGCMPSPVPRTVMSPKSKMRPRIDWFTSTLSTLSMFISIV